MITLKIYAEKMQPNIEKFYYKCFTDLGWGFEPQGRHSDILSINETYMSSGCMWCLYSDDVLIGTVAVRTIDKENRIAELKRLYVLKEYQGKKHGDILFKTALNYLKSKQLKKYTQTRGMTEMRLNI